MEQHCGVGGGEGGFEAKSTERGRRGGGKGRREVYKKGEEREVGEMQCGP